MSTTSAAPSGAIAVCFAATSGLGKHAALELAKRGADVIVVGRDEARAEEVAAAVRALNPKSTSHTVPILVNAFSSSSIKACCAAIREVPAVKARGINYLVLPQGMATTQGYTPTADGFDEKLTLHFFSRMLVIELLKDELAKAADSSPNADVRVVSILSGGIHSAYEGLFDDPHLTKGAYSNQNSANAAGFYNDLQLDNYALSGRGDGVVRASGDPMPANGSAAIRVEEALRSRVAFIHHSPGFVATNWGTEMPCYIRGPVRVFQAIVATSAEKWAEEFVSHTLLGPQFSKASSAQKTNGLPGDGFGVIISKRNSVGACQKAHSPEARRAVWETVLRPYYEKAGVVA